MWITEQLLVHIDFDSSEHCGPATVWFSTFIKIAFMFSRRRKLRLEEEYNIFLFVTYTVIQSITSSEMCSLHLTHPSAHTPGAVHPGSSWGFASLLKGLTSVVDNFCRSRDSNPQPRVKSPTLYPIGHGFPGLKQLLSK